MKNMRSILVVQQAGRMHRVEGVAPDMISPIYQKNILMKH